MNGYLFESSLWYVGLGVHEFAEEAEDQIRPEVDFYNVVKDEMECVGWLRECNIVHG